MIQCLDKRYWNEVISLKINAIECINDYVDNPNKSKLSIDMQGYLNLEDKVKNLKLSVE